MWETALGRKGRESAASVAWIRIVCEWTSAGEWAENQDQAVLFSDRGAVVDGVSVVPRAHNYRVDRNDFLSCSSRWWPGWEVFPFEHSFTASATPSWILLMLPSPDLPGIGFLHTNDLVAVENTKRVKGLLQLFQRISDMRPNWDMWIRGLPFS